MGNKKNTSKKLSKLKIRKTKKEIWNYELLTYNQGADVPNHSFDEISADNSLPTITTENTQENYEIVIDENKNSDSQFQPLSGRRIIDINYFFRELQEKARHNKLFDCNLNNFQLIGERRLGLLSIFKFECNMCKEVCLVRSDNSNENININIAATSGVIASGIGFSQFEELCSAMDVPVFSAKYYIKFQDKVYEAWEKTAANSMAAAAKKEKEIAIAEGRIKNGYPVIDVYVDGSWCARSYGSNYKASSGTAAIIGRRTGQVLYLGVKNKYCIFCARAEKNNTVPKQHTCFKNHEGSASSMEAAIIVEGFKAPISMYGIIYSRMIADGDASTYSKILNAKPYEAHNVTVEKIECRNHILRNLCKKLRGLTTDTKYLLIHRKSLTNEKIMSIRKVIVNAIRYYKSSEREKCSAILNLHKDIINSVSHAYGDHRMCQDYNCKKKSLQNGLKDIQNSTFLFRINAIISNVASKSRSLIEDVDTNAVECFNNVIAKFIGGKRVNFALKRGYQGRCAAALVSFNSKSAISSVQAAFTNKNPEGRVKEIERRRAHKRKLNIENPTKKRRKLKEVNRMQHEYGPTSSAPDMPDDELNKAKEEFVKNLKVLTMNRHCIERSTVLQKDSSEWLEIRKNLVTASNFGLICKRKISIGTAPLVKNILYKKNLAHIASIAHGIENEQQAIQQIQQQEKVVISPCGLFIDEMYPFIGATPDGLISDDIIVEDKCPITAAKIEFIEAVKGNKIQSLKYDKKTHQFVINKNSNWYFQIQGQLHITQRRLCLLGIWTGEKSPVHIEYIARDDDFWNQKMESKLVTFYMKCLLPELVDSRHTRGMAIRDISLQDKEKIRPTLSQTQNNHDRAEPGPSTRQLILSEL
ncbi:hypothetical protein ACJJTC_012087 [Scirpophaga incertulas]